MQKDSLDNHEEIILKHTHRNKQRDIGERKTERERERERERMEEKKDIQVKDSTTCRKTVLYKIVKGYAQTRSEKEK